MSKEDLYVLSPIEIKLLFYRCKDNDIGWIVTKLLINNTKYYEIQRDAFKKLKISGKGKQRWPKFRQEYCDIVKKLTEDELKNWGQEKPEEPEEAEEEETQEELEKPEEEPDERPKPEPIGGGIVPTGGEVTGIQSIIDKVDPIIAIAATVLILFICCAGVVIISQLLPRIFPTSTQVAEKTKAPEAVATAPETPEAIAENPTDTPTFTPSATFTSTPTPTFTSTPTLSPTPAATDTPEPGSPNAGVLSSDDFQRGLNEQWNKLYGNASVVSGVLTTDDNVMLAVGDPNWINYDITLKSTASKDMHYCTDTLEHDYVAFRMQDRNNFYAFSWGRCGTAWYIVENGDWSMVPESYVQDLIQKNDHEIEIDIEGNFFQAYVDGNPQATFYDDRYTSGGLGLRIDKFVTVDDWLVKALP